MRKRIWIRAAALVGAAVAVIAGLTLYFSSEGVPPCLASGAPKWRPPTDGQVHRFMLVVPDGAACFFALDNEQELVGTVRLKDARAPSVAAPLGDEVAVRTASGPYTLNLRNGHFTKGGLAPFDSGTLTVVDQEHGVMYVTQRNRLGFRVLDLATGATRYVVHFKGFTWNRRFGPNPPSHGLALAPDRPELWVLDSPNRTLHVFDVSAVPQSPPRPVEDVRLERTMTRPGALLQSADGRYLYVGDAGDVIDTQTRTSLLQLAALANARALLEIDWVNGRPLFPGYPR